MWTLFQNKLQNIFSHLKISVDTDRIFTCLENLVWLALKALQSPLLSVDHILQGTGWSTKQYQTVSCSFPVVKLPHHTGMCIESAVALFFISVVLVQLMLQLLRKPKISKAFLYQFQYQGGSCSLWWHWLVHMRILACLPLNSCGPQGRKSAKQVSEVLLY